MMDLLQKYNKRKLADVGILLIGSMWLLGFVSFLGIIFLGNYDLSYTMSVLICLGVFPYCYIGRCYPYMNRVLPRYLKYWKFLAGLTIIVLFTVNHLTVNRSVAEIGFIGLKYLIVAVSEEILFRYYLQTLLEEQFSEWLALFLQTFLFAFLLHSGLPLSLNLFIRLPAGILLTLIFKRTGDLSIPIIIHLLYDAIIHIIWL